MEILLTDGKHMISHGIFGVHFNITITKNKRIVPLAARIVQFWNYLQVTYSYIHHDSSALQKFKYYVHISSGNCKLFSAEQTDICTNVSALGKARLSSIFYVRYISFASVLCCDCQYFFSSIQKHYEVGRATNITDPVIQTISLHSLFSSSLLRREYGHGAPKHQRLIL